MQGRRYIASIFIVLSLVLAIVFYLDIDYPKDIGGYFEKTYFGQLGPLAICVELLFASVYLFKGHKKSNFALALFAFTALLDIILNLTGVFISEVPYYAMILFFICAITSLYIAFSNAFGLGKITLLGVIISFVFGSAIELYFNYL